MKTHDDKGRTFFSNGKMGVKVDMAQIRIAHLEQTPVFADHDCMIEVHPERVSETSKRRMMTQVRVKISSARRTRFPDLSKQRTPIMTGEFVQFWRLCCIHAWDMFFVFA
jgi:hypothetical protein